MTKKLKSIVALISCIAVIFGMSVTAFAADPTREQLYDAAEAFSDACFSTSNVTAKEYDDLSVTKVNMTSQYVYEVTARANNNRYICDMVISFNEETGEFTLESYDVMRENSELFGWIGYILEVLQRFFLEMFSGYGIYDYPFEK